MKSKLSALIVLFASLFLLNAADASAQGGTAPSSQMGIGVAVSTTGVGTATFQYAINPSFQIGTGFLLAGSSAEGSSTVIGFSPYARFILEGSVNPIIQAGFYLTKAGEGDALTGLYAAGGLEYFMSRNAGIYGLLTIIDIGLNSGAPIRYGIPGAGAQMGIEWFFNR